MFTESAAFYDAIYFAFKDYRAEADDIARRIRALHPLARTVLDVACGTGEHARLLSSHHGFEVGLPMLPATPGPGRHRHRRALVSAVEETLRAFAAGGLEATHEAASSTNRGLYFARVKSA